MKNKIPCEIIKDLLPSYIDNLTSDASNSMIKEHLLTCESCRDTVKCMGKAEEIIMEEDRKEIDFLKENKKRNKRKIITISVIMLLVVAFFIWKTYFLAFPTPYDFMNLELDVKEKEIVIDGNLWLQDRGVRSVEFVENNGVVIIDVNETKKSIISPNYFHGEYTSEREIKEIWIATKIVWANGTHIDKETSNIYSEKWSNVGDNTHMARIIIASGLDDLIGEHTMEIHTEKMPYGITLNTDRQFSEDVHQDIITRMKQYSAIVIGSTSNLDYITYNYYVNGEQVSLTITEEDVDKFVGKPVKEQFESADKLQEMMASMGMI